MSNDSLTDLRVRFDAAYIFPFAKHSWKTKRGRLCWVELEVLQAALAGPLYHLIECGDCAYVYTRDDEYFAGVNDPAALLARLQQWHDQLIAGLDRFIPRTQAEATDLASMRQFASEMWAIAEQAIGIERARWAVAQAEGAPTENFADR